VIPKKALIVLLIFIFLTPLGLLAPGEAWGEWDISSWNVSNSWKSVAEGFASLWNAPLSDYNVPGWEEGFLPYLGYIISGIVGVILIIVVTTVVGKALAGREK